MLTRVVSIVTAVALLLTSVSCAVHRTTVRSPQDVADGVHVQALHTRSGTSVEFSPAVKLRRQGDMLSIRDMSLRLSRTQAEVVESSELNDRKWRFLFKDGLEFTGLIYGRKDGTITLDATSLSIPASQVDMVVVREVNAGMTFLAALGVGFGLLAATVLIALATKESCPFVYSFDGDLYTLDGEPYGGATCEALKRTEWSSLNHLREVGGKYRLKLTNEVDETQYTDELKLVVVDHPRGVAVVPAEDGSLHSVSRLVTPLRAVDGWGRDILSQVSKDDWIAWLSPPESLEAATSSGTKERLAFEFPKPRGATRARLVFDGGNTLWASQMVKRFLSLHGTGLDRYYASLEAPGAREQLEAWSLREELFRMSVRVSTPNGLVSRGSVVGGGPFVTRAKLYDLDVSDVPGDVLRIELTPAAGFWMIDHLGVDYGTDVPLTVREIGAARAVDSSGADVRDLLASTDGRYFAMPVTGDMADLVFDAPPAVPGWARSVMLKASGYYDIHMGTLGPPRSDILLRLIAEPGYPVRFALEELALRRAEGQ